ncbi:MAG: NADH-quinone oxidoreductase subunit L [Candidatus Omnitrophota bacterium]
MVALTARYAWLVLLFPACGALINGLWGRRYLKEKAHWVAVPAVFLSFLLSLVLFASVLKNGRSQEIFLYSWVVSADFEAPFGLFLDSLSCTMLLVVTGIGLLVHIYSVGYMRGDGGYARFFSYLNLFVFFMLILVLADNYLFMFMGWEGVGLCSYLLIGFWFHKKSATDAANKAFIANRIGDAGFILGILLLFFAVGSVSFSDVFGAAPTLDKGLVTAAALLLFAGAIGKSAQIPLYVWLPDAMEGPTPVSALIHAATMVTAGIYMVCRSHLLYTLAPVTMGLVALTGAATALFAASIAIVQNDMKKVLAYSTISQLGLMFLALGVGAFTSGMFHLVTHAFFKALLFLCAGSIAHAASGEQNIQKLGGLMKRLPVTHAAFLVGALAIAGIPPFAGFWSKDEILAQLLWRGHPVFFTVASLASFLTAFYIFRLLFLVFYGMTRLPEEAKQRLHESPAAMTSALIVLAILAASGGLLGFPPEQGALHRFLGPTFGAGHEAPPFSSLNVMLMGSSVAVAGLGWFFAWLLYQKRKDLPAKMVARMTALYRLLLHKYWVDELYDKTVLAFSRWLTAASSNCDRLVIDGAVNGIAHMALVLSRAKDFFDQKIVDGAANGLARWTQRGSGRLRRIQTGGVQNYALTMAGGIVVLVGFILIF